MKKIVICLIGISLFCTLTSCLKYITILINHPATPMSTETITAFQQGIITQPTSTLQQLPFDATDVSDNGWENSQEDTTGMDISLSYLFDNAGDYKYIFPAYSADDQSGAPWGFRHQGLDLITATSARVLTPANGLVQQVEVYLNPVNNLWQVNIHIKYDDHYSYNLMFEPRAAKSEQIALQRAAILVEENDRVTEGDTLGTILNLSSEESGFGDVTVHFDLWMDGQNVCPEPYFKPEVLTTMLALLHAKYPDGQLCYP